MSQQATASSVDLYRVTITGADDTVDVNDLADFVERWPFVELGILVGAYLNVPRFPSLDWMNRLTERFSQNRHRYKVSLHVCGQALDRLIKAGNLPTTGAVGGFTYDRLQLNASNLGNLVPQQLYLLTDCMLSQRWPARETIVQANGFDNRFLDNLMQADLRLTCPGSPKFSVLLDASGGKGKTPKSWDFQFFKYTGSQGYAGGICAENVLEEIARIESSRQGIGGFFLPYWIDIETGARIVTAETDYFSLDKCEEIVKKIANAIPFLMPTNRETYC